MNTNRPFFSTNTNIYDERFCGPALGALNGQPVTLGQEQPRNWLLFNSNFAGLPYQQNQCPGGFPMQAEKVFIPNGVAFLFGHRAPITSQGPVIQKVCCCSPPNCNCNQGSSYVPPNGIEQHIAMTGLQQHGFGSLQYQEQMRRNPFLLKFHQDMETSSTDLLNSFNQPTQSYASNNCGVISEQSSGPSIPSSQHDQVTEVQNCYTPHTNQTQKLHLCESTKPNSEENMCKDKHKGTNKKVNFAGCNSDEENMSGEKAEKQCKTCQVTLCVCSVENNFTCNTGKKNRSRSKYRKQKLKKKERCSDNSSSSSCSNPNSDNSLENLPLFTEMIDGISDLVVELSKNTILRESDTTDTTDPSVKDSKNIKKLTFTRPPNISRGHVKDVLDSEEDEASKSQESYTENTNKGKNRKGPQRKSHDKT